PMGTSVIRFELTVLPVLAAGSATRLLPATSLPVVPANRVAFAPVAPVLIHWFAFVPPTDTPVALTPLKLRMMLFLTSRFDRLKVVVVGAPLTSRVPASCASTPKVANVFGAPVVPGSPSRVRPTTPTPSAATRTKALLLLLSAVPSGFWRIDSAPRAGFGVTGLAKLVGLTVAFWRPSRVRPVGYALVGAGLLTLVSGTRPKAGTLTVSRYVPGSTSTVVFDRPFNPPTKSTAS